MLPQTELILAAVAKALDARAPEKPYYIRQPMLAVADAITQLKGSPNGNYDYIRRRSHGDFRS